MFRALFAHLQEALRKLPFVFWCVLRLLAAKQNTDCLCSASWRWASSAWNMWKPLIYNQLNTKSASRWFYYTDILRCTVNKTYNMRFGRNIATSAYNSRCYMSVDLLLSARSTWKGQQGRCEMCVHKRTSVHPKCLHHKLHFSCKE
jgi:hypothetical protein